MIALLEITFSGAVMQGQISYHRASSTQPPDVFVAVSDM